MMSLTATNYEISLYTTGDYICLELDVKLEGLTIYLLRIIVLVG